MFSGLFSHKKNKTELTIIFDIGSGSVGAALVELAYLNKPTILYSTRKDIAFNEEINPNKLLSSMKTAMESVAQNVQKIGFKNETLGHLKNKNIGTVYCVFSAPWYLAQPKRITQTYADKKNITNSFIKKILQKEEETFLENTAKEYTNKHEEELYLLEHVITNIETDGYEIQSIRGQETKNLNLSIFSSLIPEKVAKTAISVVASVFHTDNLHLHSFSMVSFGVVRDVLDLKDFIFIDISGEVTEVNLVSRGELVESGSFPFGINTHARLLSKKLQTNPDEALSRLSSIGDKKRDVLVFGDKEKNTVSDTNDDWNKQFSELLGKFSGKYTLSPNVVFTVDSRFIKFFEESLKSDTVKNAVSYGNEPNIIPITDDFLLEYIHMAKSAKTDSFISIETLFFNTSHENYDKKDFATFNK